MGNSPIAHQTFTGKSVVVAKILDDGERKVGFFSSISENRESQMRNFGIRLERSFQVGRESRRRLWHQILIYIYTFFFEN